MNLSYNPPPSLSTFGRNELEKRLTEADSRLTSRRSNYRIFIRTVFARWPAFVLSPSSLCFKARARAKKREREEREFGIKRATGFNPCRFSRKVPPRKITSRRLIAAQSFEISSPFRANSKGKEGFKISKISYQQKVVAKGYFPRNLQLNIHRLGRLCVCVCFFSNEADDSTPLLVDARAEIRECHATFRDV